MTGLLMKIITCPLILLISDYIFRDVHYAYTYQPVLVGIILAVVGHLMELALLKPGTVIISTIADFLAAFVVVYLTQFIFSGAIVTLIGSAIVSTIVAIVEYLDHVYLVKTNKTQKPE